MSGDPVLTRNAILFTPDNKHAYAMSGIVGVNATEKTLIEFNTYSEYLKAEVLLYNESGSGDDFRYKVKFNDIVVVSTYSNSGNDFLLDTPIRIIIPPFTNIKITADNISADTNRNHTCNVIAKAYGMAEVGYQ